MRLPRKPLEAARSRWRALSASTPWARVRALEERLESMRREVVALRERVEVFEEEDVIHRIDTLEDIPELVEDVENAVRDLRDEMPSEEAMADAARDAVAALARQLRDALDDMG